MADRGAYFNKLLEQWFALQLRVVKLFDEAGVQMVTGSDFGGMWLVKGNSLHHEFDLFAQAGVKPLRVHK